MKIYYLLINGKLFTSALPIFFGWPPLHIFLLSFSVTFFRITNKLDKMPYFFLCLDFLNDIFGFKCN